MTVDHDADRQGDHPAVAAELIATLGPELVAACDVSAGLRVLDVGAGAGNAAIPAAAAGASVVASDLTPELFEVGRRDAAAAGVELEWVEADAESLPFATDQFDVVLSCLGAMFAPRHQLTANELVRVCRPGGVIGMINWTPEGFIGNLLATMAPYAPSPPDAQPPTLWGSEAHVRELLGDRVTALDMRRRQIVLDRWADPTEFREDWKQRFGPTIAVYGFIAADPERVAALDRDFLTFLTAWNRAGAGAPPRYEAEYLLLTARKTPDST